MDTTTNPIYRQKIVSAQKIQQLWMNRQWLKLAYLIENNIESIIDRDILYTVSNYPPIMEMLVRQHNIEIPIDIRIRFNEAVLALSMEFFKRDISKIEEYGIGYLTPYYNNYWKPILDILAELYSNCIEKRVIYEIHLDIIRIVLILARKTYKGKYGDDAINEYQETQSTLQNQFAQCVIKQQQNKQYLRARSMLNAHRGFRQATMSTNSDSKHNRYLAIVRKLARDWKKDAAVDNTTHSQTDFKSVFSNKAKTFPNIKRSQDGKISLTLSIPSGQPKWGDLLNYYSLQSSTR